LTPWFIGSYGENDDLFEELLLELFREHMSWRRDVHPIDSPVVRNSENLKPEYIQAVAEMKEQLSQLTANLKLSAPINSPQYFADMSSDLLLPSLIAQLATTLYNPNNASSDSAAVIIDMELEAGRQIARMIGYNTNSEQQPCAWGHITSGGTTANYESLWNARAASFYPLALKAAANKLHISLRVSTSSDKLLSECSSWQCQNFNVDEVVALQKYCYQQLVKDKGIQTANNFFKQVNLHRVEHMGMASFFAEHWDAKQPMILIPSTAHSSWTKALKILGFGANKLIKLDVNNRLRLEIGSLKRILSNAEQKKIPIMAVVGILGAEEFGSIDPIAEIVKLREFYSSKGLNFYFLVDAAWGGYLCSLFRNEDNSLISHSEIKNQFNFFPSQSIYEAFSNIHQADSVTIDPHKMGYLPFGTGAFISRNRDITLLLNSTNPFEDASCRVNIDEQLKQLDKYTLEGAKPGANAAACCLTHRVLPLNKIHFGEILSESIHASEYFFERIKVTINNLKYLVNMVIPMEPDSNLFCIAINPINNHCLTRMNRFSRRVYNHLRVTPENHPQDKAYFCSTTSLLHCNLGSQDAQQLLENLGIKNSSFVVNIEDPKIQTNSIHVLRHTLLNPSLLNKVDGLNAIDRYCDYLEGVVVEVVSKESSSTLITVGAR